MITSLISAPNEDVVPTDDSDDPPTYPKIANAFYVTRSQAYYNALYGQACAKMFRDKLALPETPIVHSYRVYNMRGQEGGPGGESQTEPSKPLIESSSVPGPVTNTVYIVFFLSLVYDY